MTFHNEIKTALYSKLTGSSTWNTNIGGRVYYISAPQNPTYPYCVFSIFSDLNTFDSASQWEETFWQFSIFDKDSSSGDIGTLESNLIDLLYGFELTPTNYTQIQFRREAKRYFFDSLEGTYHTVLEYRTEFQHD